MSGSGSLLSDWHDIYRAINKLPYNDDPHGGGLGFSEATKSFGQPKSRKHQTIWPQMIRFNKQTFPLLVCHDQ